MLDNPAAACLDTVLVPDTRNRREGRAHPPRAPPRFPPASPTATPSFGENQYSFPVIPFFVCVFRPNSLKIGTASVKQTQEACLNTWKKSFMIGSLLFTARMSSSLIHCSADSSLTTHYSGTPHPYGPSGTLSGRIWYRYPKQCRQSRSPSSAPAASRRVGSSASSHGSTPARFS